MNVQVTTYADKYFEQYLGKSLADFARPFSEQEPCGPDLRLKGLFDEITEARREDDPNLPQGDWACELKRADWSRVTELAAGALAGTSKDLQLSAWLLESEIKQRGFAAIGPCLILINSLVCDYWQQLNPPVEENERRHNIFRWIDDKLPHVINQIPVAINIDGSESFSGLDRDKALANEHLLEAKLVDKEKFEELRLKDFEALVARTANEIYADAYLYLEQAINELEKLKQTLDQIMGDSEAPGFKQLGEQLQKSLKFVEFELEQRGLLNEVIENLSTEDCSDESDAEQVNSQETAGVDEKDMATDVSIDGSAGREKAYEQLANIAHYLAGIEPHSPVPYLVMRAVEWGSYNTAELYQDLFLVNKGQIDLFEIMGITAHQENSNAGS